MRRVPVGLLVVRAWVEPGSADPLRATIRLTTDTAAGFTKEVSVSEVPAVTEVVLAWLEEIVGDS